MKKNNYILVFLLLITLFPSSRLYADHSKELKNLENKRKIALQDIERTSKLLVDTKKTTETLLNRIQLVSSQISSRQSLISVLNQEITVITKEQKKTEADIKILEVDLAQKQDNYATAIKGMLRKKQNSNDLIFILSGKTFGESLRRIKYMKDYSTWRNDQAEEIKQKKNELSDKKLALEKTKKEKQSLLALRQSEQSKLKKEEEDLQTDVSEANKKQKELQADLNKKRKNAEALNNQIQKLIAEEIARQQREAKRIAEEKAKAEGKDPSKVVVTQSKENVKLSNNFAANKGRFPMPVTGAATIISQFGEVRDKKWRNVSTNSAGVDIQTQAGAEVRTIFNGEVSRIIVFPGYNNCVIIRHGDYFTFYGNVHQLYVKQGQQVTTGESIGKVFTDDKGLSVLHFQIWKNQTKLNPALWLQR